MKKKFFTILAIITIATITLPSCCSVIDGDRRAISFETKAEELNKQGDYKNAVGWYLKAAEAFEEIGQYNLAIENYSKAREILPEVSKDIDSKVETLKKKQ